MFKLSHLQLSHFSPEVVHAVRSEEAGESAKEAALIEPGCVKPKGLWLSVDGGWDWEALNRTWNRDPGIRHKVVLKDTANVLILRNAEDVEAVASWYLIPAPLGEQKINWRAVGEDWDGILMLSLGWPVTLAHEIHWTRYWSVPSGCIWNADAIASIRH